MLVFVSGGARGVPGVGVVQRHVGLERAALRRALLPLLAVLARPRRPLPLQVGVGDGKHRPTNY